MRGSRDISNRYKSGRSILVALLLISITTVAILNNRTVEAASYKSYIYKSKSNDVTSLGNEGIQTTKSSSSPEENNNGGDSGTSDVLLKNYANLMPNGYDPRIYERDSSLMMGKEYDNSNAYMVFLKQDLKEEEVVNHMNWIHDKVIRDTSAQELKELRSDNESDVADDPIEFYKNRKDLPKYGIHYLYTSGYAGRFPPEVVEEIRKRPEVEFVIQSSSTSSARASSEAVVVEIDSNNVDLGPDVLSSDSHSQCGNLMSQNGEQHFQEESSGPEVTIMNTQDGKWTPIQVPNPGSFGQDEMQDIAQIIDQILGNNHMFGFHKEAPGPDPNQPKSYELIHSNQPGQNQPSPYQPVDPNQPGQNEPSPNQPGKNEPSPYQPIGPNQPRQNQPSPYQPVDPNQPGKNEPSPYQPIGPNQPRQNQPSSYQPIGPNQPRQNRPRQNQPRQNQPRQNRPDPNQQDQDEQDMKRGAREVQVQPRQGYGQARDVNRLAWGVYRVNQRQSLSSSGLRPLTSNGSEGSGVDVYIIDGAVDVTHPEISENIITDHPLSNPSEYLFSGFERTPFGRSAMGHATHIAGTIAGKTVGVAPRANIIPVPSYYNPSVVGNGSNPYDRASIDRVNFSDDAISRMDWVLRRSQARGGAPGIINASFYVDNQYGTQSGALWQRYVQQLEGNNVITVAASGNQGIKSGDFFCHMFSPQQARGVINVASIDNNDNIALDSNVGSCVSIAAPGVGIYSSLPAGSYGFMSGTSMAAPHVVGILAQYRSRNPNASIDQVKQLMMKCATRLPSGVPVAYNCMEEGI